MKLLRLILLTIMLGLLQPGTVLSAIENTVHNLSSNSGNTIRASSESQICIFCHTPHNSSSSGALWNRYQPTNSFTPYTSTTAAALPGQPTGASLLCLSCHDGTIALGQLRNPNTTLSMVGVTHMPSGSTLIGTDLTDDHPVSFSYAASISGGNDELQPVSTLTGPVRLDASGQVQCTSCHDPHNNDLGNFLVMANTSGALCVTCHDRTGWGGSSHNMANACQNCHQPHNAGSEQRLLINAVAEDNCLGCHDGSPAQNINSELNKFSRHPVISSGMEGVHDPAEPAVVNQRHVECADCHNPHAVTNSGSPSGPLVGVRGVDTNGSEIDPINREYQLCYRCHADSNGKPPSRTSRAVNETNVRVEFDTSNVSYHPVEGARQSNRVPSLLPGLTPSSVIDCTDCHNNDNLSGPRGPHGSNNVPLLERRYVTTDPNSYTQADYALCFKCHSANSITSNASGFPHNVHIGASGGMMGNVNAPCNTCHDPHGVGTSSGTGDHIQLINFNTDVVDYNQSGLRYFQDNGNFSGSCYLNCHGQEHNPCSYNSGGGMGGMGCMGGMGGGGGGGPGGMGGG